MAKEIKFNIKLLIDGKEQLVTASTSAKELRDNLDAAKSSAAKFREKMITVSQTVAALQNASSAINGLRDTMAGLTASYNAVQQANTQLTTVMRQRMDATEEDIKKVNEVIGAQSKLGVIGGTIQKTGAQQIATFLKEKGTLEQLSLVQRIQVMVSLHILIAFFALYEFFLFKIISLLSPYKTTT